MAEGNFYNTVTMLKEAERYRTTNKFLDMLYSELNRSKRLMLTGLGARLTAVTSSLTEELWGVDINQGSIDRAVELTKSWNECKDKEPFRTEAIFMESKGLKPNFENYQFYLKGNIPSGLDNSFDGELASELFLHLDGAKILDILKEAHCRLKPDGKFIFTFYPSGYKNSLDAEFRKLCSDYGIDGTDFIKCDEISGDSRTIKVGKIANILKRRHDLYEKHRESYWLDLAAIRAFSEEYIQKLCKDSGFKKYREEDVTGGGMFHFAHRLAYVMVK